MLQLNESVRQQILAMFGHLYEDGTIIEIAVETGLSTQNDCWSCGLRAVAFITHLLLGIDPAKFVSKTCKNLPELTTCTNLWMLLKTNERETTFHCCFNGCLQEAPRVCLARGLKYMEGPKWLWALKFFQLPWSSSFIYLFSICCFSVFTFHFHIVFFHFCASTAHLFFILRFR